MAFNPSPEVAMARDFANQFKKRQVIIIHLDDEKLGYASYGETAALCRDAKKLADVAYEALMQYFAECYSKQR